MATATIDGNSVKVTAVGGGIATITVTDTQSGQTATIDVTVEFFPLTLSTSSLEMSIGDEESVSITSGNGSYCVQSSDANVATATIDGNSVKVTAVGGGTATITMTDAQSGKTADITVTVEYFPLTLSASSMILLFSEEGIVNITSGNGSFSLQNSDTNVVKAKLVGFSIKITPTSAGNATITIIDTKSGQMATVEVTVYATLTHCPDNNHPHAIDLGLPSGTKWACCNVGADAPENYGGYFAWGETEEKDSYTPNTYQYYEPGYYNTGRYVSIGSNICGTEYDVAYVEWGDNWKMPTINQLSELRGNCTFEWTKVNGIKGCRFTGPNGGTIFLPAAGYRDSGLELCGTNGIYWSGILNQTVSNSCANSLEFSNTDSQLYEDMNRYRGIPVRPVAK